MEKGELNGEAILPNGMKNREPDFNEFSVQEWAKTPLAEYDQNEAYFEKVHPLMVQVHDLCVELKIPFMWYCCPMHSEEGRQVESCSWMGGPSIPTPELLALQVVAYDEDLLHEKIAAIGAAYDRKLAISKK